MKICRIVLSLLCSAVTVSAAYQVSWAEPLPTLAAPAASDDEDMEVYTRGTLHEAFATPVSNDVVVPPVVPKEPPAMIEELPPEQQPEGDNVTWISGYWAFDEELDDYIWISGLWRDVPPGRQWVPGYWAQTPDGYQWVAGMWTEVGSTEISYLPTPPDSLERGPQVVTPGPDYFYVPGCWEFHNARYVWRGGYWAPRQREWIWVPAHYVHTPYGCCFVAGHWDLALVDRGLCYAPVRFVRPRPAFVYRPVIVIDTWDSMCMHLWVDPRRGCYTYGNYYEPRHAHYVPWYEYRGHGGGHDHLFAYYEWRNGPQYRQRLTGWHDHFVSNRDWRPPPTFREQARWIENRRSTTNVNINLNLAIDVRKIDRDRDRDMRLPVNLKQVSRDDDSRFREQAKSWATVAQNRKQVEAERIGRPPVARPDKGGPQEAKRVTLELPKAVAVAKRDVPKLETPDKLKDVKPDKPRGEEIRVPSKTKEQRVAQEKILKRDRPERPDRPDAKQDEVDSPTDVPPPPPKGARGDQASKDDKNDKKPDARDAFGLDSPGRGERGKESMPDRPGRPERVQTDRDKPGSNQPDAEPKKDPPAMKDEGRDNDPNSRPPRPMADRPDQADKKGEGDAKKPEMRRDVPDTDTAKPKVERPERTPMNDGGRKPNDVPPREDRGPKASPRPDGDKNPPRANAGDSTPPRRTETPLTRPNSPAMERRENREQNRPPIGNRPLERPPEPKRTEPKDAPSSRPSPERKPETPRANNQPPRKSTETPRRNERPKAPTPERKGAAPKPEPKEKEKKDEKEKAEKEPKAG